jgi:hypothetical protein
MRRLLAALAGSFALTSVAGAAIVYAPNNLARPLDGPDELIMFDSSNPAAFTVIGSMNVPNIGFGGMDFDADGNLWAFASFFKNTGGAASGLYRVNTKTGQATVQGSIGLQPLEDIAFNPVDGQMYGVRTQGNITRLYRINLTTGAVTLFGVCTGVPEDSHAMSFAIDSTGHFYVHDIGVEKIYKSTAPGSLTLAELYTIPQDTSFSQGMTIDWSRDNAGYHAAVGYGEFPHYFSQLNTFAADGSGYVLGPEFGPELDDGLPPVEAGDLAIEPALPSCAADTDGSGSVDVDDLVAVILGWGGCPAPPASCPADVDDSGSVDVDDLIAVILAWGACP